MSGVSGFGGGAAVRPENSQRVFDFHALGPQGILTPGMLLISSWKGLLWVEGKGCDGECEMGGTGSPQAGESLLHGPRTHGKI